MSFKVVINIFSRIRGQVFSCFSSAGFAYFGISMLLLFLGVLGLFLSHRLIAMCYEPLKKHMILGLSISLMSIKFDVFCMLLKTPRCRGRFVRFVII